MLTSDYFSTIHPSMSKRRTDSRSPLKLILRGSAKRSGVCLRRAKRALGFSVVIDVAMTETTRGADAVLPASGQYENPESASKGKRRPEITPASSRVG